MQADGSMPKPYRIFLSIFPLLLSCPLLFLDYWQCGPWRRGQQGSTTNGREAIGRAWPRQGGRHRREGEQAEHEKEEESEADLAWEFIDDERAVPKKEFERVSLVAK